MFEKLLDVLRVGASREVVIVDLLPKYHPAGGAMLQDQLVLNVAKARSRGGVRVHTQQALARCGGAATERFEPALGFFLERVQTAVRRQCLSTQAWPERDGL